MTETQTKPQLAPQQFALAAVKVSGQNSIRILGQKSDVAEMIVSLPSFADGWAEEADMNLNLDGSWRWLAVQTVDLVGISRERANTLSQGWRS